MASLEEFSPAKLQDAYDKASDAQEIAGDEIIKAGRGFETGSETRALAAEGDVLAIRWVEAADKFNAVVDEMDRRKRWHGSLKRTPKSKL